jgi:PAS domain S-box-containing protein
MLTAGPLLVVRSEANASTVTYVSPNIERLFGHTDAEARASMFLADHTHPEDLAEAMVAFEQVVSGRTQQAAVEVRLRNAAGESRWIASEMVPEIGEDGQVVAVLTYCVDVDDRHRAEDARREAQQAAESANQAKSAFLSHMSHELRTPLNAVLGFGQVLEFEDITDSQREAVGHILDGGRHLLGLINEVLDISRIETGDMPLSPEVVDPSELVRESIELIRPIATQRGIALALDDTLVGCSVYADRQRVKQVLLNLLSNAVKYNRPGGRVTVFSECLGKHRIAIRVRDTGPGIAAERIPDLFVPFERLGAENTDVEGTGIGLTLAQQLAQMMGGTIGVVSVVGEGSTFSVELPAVIAEVPDSSEARRGDPSTLSRRVLHIEDSLANVKLVERILARHGEFDVIPAMTGSLGIELARDHHPMLVLLDLTLPDMSGELVLRRLRSEPATAGIPVVVLSSDATPDQARRLLAAGAHAYLTKPVDVPELLRVLNETVALQSLAVSTGT